MLVRDKISENKNFDDSGIKKSQNNSELMLSKKNFLKEKVESIVSDTVSKNEKEILSNTADVIEALLSNIRSAGIPESELVKLIEQKKSLFGSYDEGFIQEKEG